MLHKSVKKELVELESQIRSFDSRVKRITQISTGYLTGLSGESNRALTEAHEIIDVLKDFSDEVRDLVISDDDEDWERAELLLRQRVLPVSRTTAIQGFRLSNAQNWNERLEQCIQKIGGDIFQITELYRKNFKPVNERIPTTVGELVEVGIRPAMNRVRFEVLHSTQFQMANSKPHHGKA